MRRWKLAAGAAALLTVFGAALVAQEHAHKPAPPAPPPPARHAMVTPDEVKWGPAPPSLPPGAQMAVLNGDPSVKGQPFVIRAKFSDGYRVPPHWHPTDEHLTILAGTLGVGLGEKFDPAQGRELTAGSFAKMPKETRHFAWAKGETIIQVHGTGPFEVTYVNPADDPRRKSASQ